MVTKVVPGLLIATTDAAHAAREACGRMTRALRDALRDRGIATIALSGGSSPNDAYRRLAQESLDWSRVHVFWVDERAVPPTHARSNYAAAKEAFLDAAKIPSANVHRMVGESDDLDKAAASYEAELREVVAARDGGVPSLDLVVLGVGDDGHTASLFPNEPTVHERERSVVAIPASATHEARITLTTSVLEAARATVLIVLGAGKHAALEKVWATNGDVGATPARIVRGFRGQVTWVIDRAAGGVS